MQESAQIGFDGKSKLPQVGYAKGHCVSWDVALPPTKQQTIHGLIHMDCVTNPINRSDCILLVAKEVNKLQVH
jgi:hypothetical protein